MPRHSKTHFETIHADTRAFVFSRKRKLQRRNKQLKTRKGPKQRNENGVRAQSRMLRSIPTPNPTCSPIRVYVLSVSYTHDLPDFLSAETKPKPKKPKQLGKRPNETPSSPKKRKPNAPPPNPQPKPPSRNLAAHSTSPNSMTPPILPNPVPP